MGIIRIVRERYWGIRLRWVERVGRESRGKIYWSWGVFGGVEEIEFNLNYLVYMKVIFIRSFSNVEWRVLIGSFLWIDRVFMVRLGYS